MSEVPDMKKFFIFLITAIICLSLSNSHGWECMTGCKAIPQRKQECNLTSSKWFLFIIDFDSFMCLSCLDSFLEFYHQLPSSLEEGRIWGILVFDEPARIAEQDHHFRIVEKKLRGFIKANQIKFPVLIDRFKAFKDLGEEGTAVVVFDGEKKTIKKYVFPLRQKQKKEIMTIIR